MRDVEKWLLNAPRVTAPENFMESLMARIRNENIAPLPVRPALPVNTIGYALIATAAAMLLLMPFMSDIVQSVSSAVGEVAGFLGNLFQMPQRMQPWTLRP